MPENCTVYCARLSWPVVLQAATDLFERVETVSKRKGKESFEISVKRGSIRLTNKQFSKPADDFSKLICTTYWAVDRTEPPDEKKKGRVLAHIESSKSIIGVVAEPGFDADERFSQLVFTIARSSDGIVFNGDEMLSADGEPLLSVRL